MSTNPSHPCYTALKSCEETCESIEKQSCYPIAEGSDLVSKPETTSSSTDFAAEEIHDEESEFSMGKLIRQASLKSSNTIHAPKGVTTISSNTSRLMKFELDNKKLERLRPRRRMSQLKTQKSLSDLDLLSGNRSTGEDMKEQIKFWARAVASNVRQEC